MFTELERKEFLDDGMTEEEIDCLDRALAFCDTIDMVPKNIEGFIEEYKTKVPDDTINGMRAILYSAEHDPEFFKKLTALEMAMACGEEIEPRPEKPAPILEGLSDAEYKKVSDNFFNTINGLSEPDKREFLKLITNLSSEQKSDMIDRLKNN